MLRFLLWYRREGHFIAVINLGRLERLAIDDSDEVGGDFDGASRCILSVVELINGKSCMCSINKKLALIDN